MKADILREKFLKFFKSKKHKIVESDSLVPKDDPTVLFTPAGMNQFKREFLGINSGFKRAASAQRCLRTDDLEKVGETNVHHTFFEMLGNFSFGDYFKEKAIVWAWEFLTEELKIDREKLWVSIYKDDDEAYKIWKEKIKLPGHKIIRLGDKENFWPSEAKEKGPNGPCGPCSEIFYDFGKGMGCGKPDCSPACDCARFTEVWNLVFTQYNRKEGGVLKPLPNKNIDTGMGLERLAAVMQGVETNFETELFQPIVKEIIREAGPRGISNKRFVYAVSDHIRPVVFAIYDGVLPSNEERGYVIRKIIRKSVLHLRALGIKKPFLNKLVPVLAQVMKDPYPQLNKRKEDIAQVILAEERNFITTLDSSNELLKKGLAEFVNRAGSLSEGDVEKASVVAFGLYDTYGIPWELTKDWSEAQGIKLSRQIFDRELNQQKERSKSESVMKGDVFGAKDIDYRVKETGFFGYDSSLAEAKILAIIKDDAPVRKTAKGDSVSIILDKSVFYPEGGGQVGDTGKLVKGKNLFEVLDTKKAGKAILHIGRVLEGSFKKNDFVAAEIDSERRLSTARNHTATHLLQAALRKVLGVHVQQQGSFVGEDRLRFDFTHFRGLDKTELMRVEGLVNNFVMNNYRVRVKEKTLQQARKSGALAFFGEKYGNKVRVVSIDDISSELCAGTHLDCTGQTGLFKIIQESSVASGIRRIEAVTGTHAYKIINEREETLEDIASVLNTSAGRIVQELGRRNARLKELEKQLNSKELGSLKDGLDEFLREAEAVGDIKVIASVRDNLNMDLLRKGIDLIKEKTENTVAILGSRFPDRVLLVIGVTEDLCQKGFDACGLIKSAAEFIGGSGGGRKDFAQAGGNNPQGLQKAIQELKGIIGNYKKLS